MQDKRILSVQDICMEGMCILSATINPCNDDDMIVRHWAIFRKAAKGSPNGEIMVDPWIFCARVVIASDSNSL